MECTIVFFNRSIIAPSAPLCTYYNYHVVWGLIVFFVAASVCLYFIVNEESNFFNRWIWVWLCFFFFGIELGVFALCVIGPFIKLHTPSITSIAEPIEAIDDGVPDDDQNPATPAETVMVGNPVVLKRF